MSEQEGKTPLVDISTLVEHVILRDLRLLECSCSRRIEEQEHPSELQQLIHVNCARNEEIPAVAVTIKLAIFSSQTDGSDLMRVEAKFILVYGVQSLEGITDEQIGHFGQRNGLYNVWPYWREFVQSMTTRMGLPPLRMPLLRPSQLRFVPEQPAEGAQSGPEATEPGTTVEQ